MVFILAATFDFIEKIGILSILNNYPNLSLWAIKTSSCAGIIKTILTIGSIAIILLLTCILIIKKTKRSK